MYDNFEYLSLADSHIQSSSRAQDQGSPFESAVITYNSTTFNVDCLFHNLSIASACVGVYWINTSNPYGLVNLNTKKFDRNGNEAHGYIDVESEGYHIAIFSFSSNKNMIAGEPLAASSTGIVDGVLY